jgi:RNA polymerase sigma factor (sigma-70 family)
MQQNEPIPHLFRMEYRKIVSVLCKLFGIDHIEIAEDIVSDTFLAATELWGLKGLPENPTAWLYAVSKNKTRDYLRRNALFTGKIAREIRRTAPELYEIEVDLSNQNIRDSQLAMMFTICHPCIPVEAQIGLSLNILCGFGVEEIADAFLSKRETIYKRLSRAREKLKTEKARIELPSPSEIHERLETVMTTLYLLFNEGYYSVSKSTVLRKDLCLEAMRLALLLVGNEHTDKSSVNALISLMCFHSSRFEARINQNGEIILYEDQDTRLWNKELIAKGEYYLSRASQGNELSRYHIEAAIAYWHTHKDDTAEKWENILQLYNQLLQMEYSPIAALNRTYALAKAKGKPQAIREAEKLGLLDNHLYHSLLGNLYSTLDNKKALQHFQTALLLAKSGPDKTAILNNMRKLGNTENLL